MKTTVISLGGSIIVPGEPSLEFLRSFKEAVERFLSENTDERLILVTGGGSVARAFQNASKAVSGNTAEYALDMIGIRATHINAELLKSIFPSLSKDPIVVDPTGEIQFTGRILVAGGWKPGFSTDNDAVILAERFGAATVINLSNIRKIYTDDPKKNPNAEPIDSVSWKDFRKMVGDEWVPGKNVPFDPVASKAADEAGITVIASDGRDIENTLNILLGKDFIGTVIHA